jgi:hypothetical protein
LFGGKKNGQFVEQNNKIPRRSPFIWDEWNILPDLAIFCDTFAARAPPPKNVE